MLQYLNKSILPLWVGKDYSAVTCFAELMTLFSKMKMCLSFQVLANKRFTIKLIFATGQLLGC